MKRFVNFRRIFQINLRTLMWVVVVAAVGMGWYRDRTMLEARLAELESDLSPGYSGWSVADVLGPPDEPTGSGANAWCPASADDQREWLELTYDKRVRASTILIYETYATGAVDKISAFDWWGREVVLWSGKDPTPPGTKGLLSIPLTKRVSTNRIKLYLDSANAPGWNCIDAVGLKTSNGTKHWASSARASSSYGYARSYRSDFLR